LFKANYEREMAQLVATLEGSGVPSVDRLSDFVDLIQEETRRSPNAALLHHEFWMYATRNPEARERLADIDEEAVLSLAELLRSQREEEEMPPLEDPVRVARVIETLFRGIGMLRVMQPDVVDEEFLSVALEFVAKGLGTADL
jgi:hypothetical protein